MLSSVDCLVLSSWIDRGSLSGEDMGFGVASRRPSVRTGGLIAGSGPDVACEHDKAPAEEMDGRAGLPLILLSCQKGSHCQSRWPTLMDVLCTMIYAQKGIRSGEPPPRSRMSGFICANQATEEKNGFLLTNKGDRPAAHRGTRAAASLVDDFRLSSRVARPETVCVDPIWCG